MKKIEIIGEISYWGNSLDSVRWQLMGYNPEIDGELVVILNSIGGDPLEALSMHAYLTPYKPTFIILGMSASAATLIPGKDSIVKAFGSSLYLIHNVERYGGVTLNNIDGVKSDLNTVTGAMIKAYQSKTDLSEKEIIKIMADGLLWNADKAKENGFIDVILPETEIADYITQEEIDKIVSERNIFSANFKEKQSFRAKLDIENPTTTFQNNIEDTKMPEPNGINIQVNREEYSNLTSKVDNLTNDLEREREKSNNLSNEIAQYKNQLTEAQKKETELNTAMNRIEELEISSVIAPYQNKLTPAEIENYKADLLEAKKLGQSGLKWFNRIIEDMKNNPSMQKIDNSLPKSNSIHSGDLPNTMQAQVDFIFGDRK